MSISEPIEILDSPQSPASNDNDELSFDVDYDEEVNRLLDEVEEDLLSTSDYVRSDTPLKDDDFPKTAPSKNYDFPKEKPSKDLSKDRPLKDYDLPKKRALKDYDLPKDRPSRDYDLPKDRPSKDYDFPKDTHHNEPTPVWYQEMLEEKIQEAKTRLEKLSNHVCAASELMAAHIKRIEEDHSTTFCKMDYPKYPPLVKPWSNSWKFKSVIQCKEEASRRGHQSHVHTTDCQSFVMQSGNRTVSSLNQNVPVNEFPRHVTDAAKLIQVFAEETTAKKSFSNSPDDVGTIYEKSMWATISIIIRSNQWNEFMIEFYGKKIMILVPLLKTFFETGSGKNCKAKSVVCIDQAWGKQLIPITGIFQLKDEVGPIEVVYDEKNYHIPFNSVETVHMAKIIQDYMGLTKDTTLLDIGYHFGVSSLIMAHKCEKVVGIHIDQGFINQAERLRKANNINNALFLWCNSKNILPTCSPLVKKRTAVAILNLSSSYCSKKHSTKVMRALRAMPSIWRVLICGSFTDEFHEDIATLTIEDNRMGNNFLPMQGCIVDKSPSVVNNFDIVILFERKATIPPKIELLAPGPTLNLDTKIYSRDLLDERRGKRKSSWGQNENFDNPRRKFGKKFEFHPRDRERSYHSTDNQLFSSTSSRLRYKSPSPTTVECLSSPSSPSATCYSEKNSEVEKSDVSHSVFTTVANGLELLEQSYENKEMEVEVIELLD